MLALGYPLPLRARVSKSAFVITLFDCHNSEARGARLAVATSYKISAHDRAPLALTVLETGLAALRERSAADPFSNPIVLFAIDLSRRIDRGEITLDDLDVLVRDLTADAFAGRARMLRAYLGETNGAANRTVLSGYIEKLAAANDFDSFRAIVERPVFGVVLTAHPTFAIALETARMLSVNACDIDVAVLPSP